MQIVLKHIMNYIPGREAINDITGSRFFNRSNAVRKTGWEVCLQLKLILNILQTRKHKAI